MKIGRNGKSRSRSFTAFRMTGKREDDDFAPLGMTANGDDGGQLRKGKRDPSLRSG
jgi:hypothetical protein